MTLRTKAALWCSVNSLLYKAIRQAARCFWVRLTLITLGATLPPPFPLYILL